MQETHRSVRERELEIETPEDEMSTDPSWIVSKESKKKKKGHVIAAEVVFQRIGRVEECTIEAHIEKRSPAPYLTAGWREAHNKYRKRTSYAFFSIYTD